VVELILLAAGPLPDGGMRPQTVASNREIYNPPSLVLRQGTSAIIAHMKRILVGVETGHLDLSNQGLTEMSVDIVES
jgi:hypothetical protein